MFPKNCLKLTTIASLIFFVSSFFANYAYADIKESKVLLICNSSGCVYPKKRNQKKATHIGLPPHKVKVLLESHKVLKIFKAKKTAIEEREERAVKRLFEYKDEVINSAHETIERQSKALEYEKKRSNALEKDNRKKTIEIAKLKGERYLYLIIGVGAGVVVLGGAVGLFFALR